MHGALGERTKQRNQANSDDCHHLKEIIHHTGVLVGILLLRVESLKLLILKAKTHSSPPKT